MKAPFTIESEDRNGRGVETSIREFWFQAEEVFFASARQHSVLWIEIRDAQGRQCAMLDRRTR